MRWLPVVQTGVAKASSVEAGNEIASPLVRQLPWTHHLIILSQSKGPEEREFYIRFIQEQWSKRGLERQFKTALFERTVLNPLKVSPLVSQTHPEALTVFKDSYLVEFLCPRDTPRPTCIAGCYAG